MSSDNKYGTPCVAEHVRIHAATQQPSLLAPPNAFGSPPCAPSVPRSWIAHYSARCDSVRSAQCSGQRTIDARGAGRRVGIGKALTIHDVCSDCLGIRCRLRHQYWRWPSWLLDAMEHNTHFTQRNTRQIKPRTRVLLWYGTGSHTVRCWGVPSRLACFVQHRNTRERRNTHTPSGNVVVGRLPRESFVRGRQPASLVDG